ncbi:MAG: type I-C CRISPR-associated protein Cas8c/Csd1, partial [Oscillospiraceae bacterium]
MSWAEELSKVYELATSAGSYIDGDSPLLPVAHSTANAQITVTLNADGTIPETGFAQAIPKGEQTTVIPVTEDSGTRTAGIAPHPLADKLIYIAG